MEKETIKVVVVEPALLPYCCTINNSNQGIRATLSSGSVICHMYERVHGDLGTMILCDEEGKYNGQIPNRVYQENDVIFGPMIIINTNKSGEYIDVTDEIIQHYNQKYNEKSVTHTIEFIYELLAGKDD